MSYERFLECDYLNAQLQPASLMLNKCVNDPVVGYDMSCTDEDKYLQGQGSFKEPRADFGLGKDNMMDTLAIQRGHEVGIETGDTRKLHSRQKQKMIGNPMIEGYENYPRYLSVYSAPPTLSALRRISTTNTIPFWVISTTLSEPHL